MFRVLVLGSLLIGASVAAAEPLVSLRATNLIVGFEVVGPKTYTRRYSHPLYPGGASGVTIGIGYDLGYNDQTTILHDWHGHPQAGYLAAMSGFRGQSAKNLAARRRWITTPYAMAYAVFQDPALVRYYNMTRRAFPGMQALSPDAQGALVSLVYNRGGNMIGDGRREMREIRDTCIPRADDRCVAAQLRIMTRVWRGSSIEYGMTTRRFAEAKLAEG